MNAAKDCTLQEKLLRCAMALILAAGALLASVAASPAYAAPSTVDVSIGGKIPYGGFATTWMSADGNIAYCAEPSSPTPAPGSYSTSPVPSGDVTAAIWYSFGSPGFDASMFPGS
ncbi:thioester domain-containing protein, partial [Paratractidigestivibacter sp.]